MLPDRDIAVKWRYARAMRSAVRQIEVCWKHTGTRAPALIELAHVFGRDFAAKANDMAERRLWRREAELAKSWSSQTAP